MNHHQAIGADRLTHEEWIALLTKTGHGELLRELLPVKISKQPAPQDRDRDLDPVLSFAEWCALNGFSQATGRRIIKRGDGPPVVQLSLRRFGIRQSDNLAWQNSRLRAGG